jgi:hypothetical protein
MLHVRYRHDRQVLSRHPKGYRICVGQHRSANGNIRPRTFWLGHDPVTAHYAAQEYQAGWSSLQLQGISLRTDEQIRSVQASIKLFEAIRREAHENVERLIENLEARKHGLLKLSRELRPVARRTAAARSTAESSGERGRCPRRRRSTRPPNDIFRF